MLQWGKKQTARGTVLYVENLSTKACFQVQVLNVPFYVNGSLNPVPSARYEHQKLLIWRSNTRVPIYSTQLEYFEVNKVILWEASPMKQEDEQRRPLLSCSLCGQYFSLCYSWLKARIKFGHIKNLVKKKRIQIKLGPNWKTTTWTAFIGIKMYCTSLYLFINITLLVCIVSFRIT